MNCTINKIYNFITNLVSLLEDELEDLKHSKSKGGINVKKSITDTLNKIVTLISQLNKLEMNSPSYRENELNQDDEMIIDNFITKFVNEQR